MNAGWRKALSVRAVPGRRLKLVWWSMCVSMATALWSGCVTMHSSNTREFRTMPPPPPKYSDQPADGKSGGAILGRLPVWDDGLSEMSYYDATDTIYGKTRRYTRVHLINRQWMNRSLGVKQEGNLDGARPVLKLNMAEEIPTENYNYRYLNTVFVDRYTLLPFKMVVSSQEWCGTSYKHLRWQDDGLRGQSFSYLPDQGESQWNLADGPLPYESLMLIARDVAAGGKGFAGRELSVLAPMRSNREVAPEVMQGRLRVSAPKAVRVPAGKFTGIEVSWDGPGPKARFVFDENEPYYLLAFEAGGVTGELRGAERRPYWSRRSQSRFYRQTEAP